MGRVGGERGEIGIGTRGRGGGGVVSGLRLRKAGMVS